MKKLLSVVFIIALLTALTVPALAAVPSVNANSDAPVYVKLANGELGEGASVVARIRSRDGSDKAVVVQSASDITPTEKSLMDEAARQFGNDAKIAEVVDIGIFDMQGEDFSDTIFQNGVSIRVPLVRNYASDVVGVLIQNDQGGWESLPFQYNADDGTVTVRFPQVGPLAFVVKDIQPADPPGGGRSDNGRPDTSNNGGSRSDLPAARKAGAAAIVTASSTKTSTSSAAATAKASASVSPKTGYNAPLWVILSISMALCAAGCCRAARTKQDD